MKPFNLEQAKAGAPYSCRDGKKVNILKWDAKGVSPLIGSVEYLDGQEFAAQWKTDGRISISATPHIRDLVMTPLAMVEDKPVFVGDELEYYFSNGWGAHTVSESTIICNDEFWRWPPVGGEL